MVLGRAAEIARAAGSSQAGPEHLMIAILHEPAAVPTQVLASLVDLDQVETAVGDMMSSPDRGAGAEALPTFWGPGAAMTLGHEYIGVEHLFLDLVRRRDAVPARALARFIDPALAEAAVLDVVGSPGYRGEPFATPGRVFLPDGQELDDALRTALFDSLPDRASIGFNWENGRPWVHVTGAGETRDVLNAALARLGRPGLD
jgi:Clp amino terminal domain, pathogenicity island component